MEIGKHYKSGPLFTPGSQFSSIPSTPLGHCLVSFTEISQEQGL